MIVQCPNCLKRYRLGEARTSLLRVRCKACGNEFLVSPSRVASVEVGRESERSSALVADIQRDFRSWVVEVLRRNQFHLVLVEDGEAALEVARERSPQLLLVNPYLPKLMGIEVIHQLREMHPTDPKIFLLGAIHSSKRYRRRPETFYGADDYIEEGASEELLLQKVHYHMNVSFEPAADESGDDPAALRLARIIFTDLMVYNPDRMAQVASVEDFFRVFPEEAAEGRRYIEERRPGTGNLLRQVVAEYLKRVATENLRPSARGEKGSP